MSRRPARMALVPRSRSASGAVVPIDAHRPTLIADVRDRCELWTLLECHAVDQAARWARQDLPGVRALFLDDHQASLPPSNPAAWHRLELQFHGAISSQARNPLLTQLVESMCGELQSIYERHLRKPIHRPGTLWLLQCQHQQILSCIEAGLPDAAMLHTRAHLHLIRDQLLAALSSLPGSRVARCQLPE